MTKKILGQAIKDSMPIVFGYLPIGLAFGMIASSNGFDPIDVFLMSAFVYAGSAQFIAVDMIAANIHPLSIIVTTFFINLRHLLMSAAYAPHLKTISSMKISILSFFITDESFAVGINEAKQDRMEFGADYLIVLGATAWLAWLIFTTLGSVIGQYVPDYYAFGFDFALVGMFIGLLALMIKNKKEVIICVAAGLLSTAFKQAGLEHWHVIFGAVVAAAIGVIGGRYGNDKSK
jgi:4-azaleucine resistance transporter AzlC